MLDSSDHNTLARQLSKILRVERPPGSIAMGKDHDWEADIARADRYIDSRRNVRRASDDAQAGFDQAARYINAARVGIG